MSSIGRPVCLLPDYTQHQLEQVVGEHVLSPRFLETQPSTMMKHDDCVNHRQNELFNVHGRTLYRFKILIHLFSNRYLMFLAFRDQVCTLTDPSKKICSSKDKGAPLVVMEGDKW